MILSIEIVITRKLLLVRYNRWILYYPSLFKIGRAKISHNFTNWSIYYLTLERKDS